DHPLHVIDQFAAPARRWERRSPHVEVDVEVRVVDPHRAGRRERRKQDLLAKPRGQVETGGDDLLDVVDLEDAARPGRRVEDGKAAHMLVDGRSLEVEERCVLRPEPLHRASLRRPDLFEGYTDRPAPASMRGRDRKGSGTWRRG